MKFEIDGKNSNSVIERIELIRNSDKEVVGIRVIYLDDSMDTIAFSEENYNRVLSIMKEQAFEFIKDKDTQIKKINRNKVISKILTILVLIACLFIGISMEVMTYLFPVLTAIVGIDVIFQMRCNYNVKELEKYSEYLNNIEGKIKEYKRIIKEEQKVEETKLSKSDKRLMKLHNISNLDKCSLDDLLRVKAKIERYNNLIGSKETIMDPVEEEQIIGNQKVKK